MKGNLDSRETLVLLQEYPEREYPEPDPVDPKTGKPIPPKKGEKPKKKKKEPPFPTPEWAIDLDAVMAKVKSLQ